MTVSYSQEINVNVVIDFLICFIDQYVCYFLKGLFILCTRIFCLHVFMHAICEPTACQAPFWLQTWGANVHVWWELIFKDEGALIFNVLDTEENPLCPFSYFIIRETGALFPASDPWNPYILYA